MSYSAVLDHSVSARREVLYKARGLDIDRWMDLVSEAKGLRREISKIGEDYDERRSGDSEESAGKDEGRAIGAEEARKREGVPGDRESSEDEEPR